MRRLSPSNGACAAVVAMLIGGFGVGSAVGAQFPGVPTNGSLPIAQQVGGDAATTPTVAVGPTGLTYLAWNTETGVDLCVMSRPSTPCRPRAVIDDGIDGFRSPPLLAVGDDGIVRLVSTTATGSPVLFVSRDGARHFTRGATLGAGQYFGGAFGPGGRLLLTNDEVGLGTLVTTVGATSPEPFVTHDQAILSNTSAAAWVGDTPVVAGATVDDGLAWNWNGQGSVDDRDDWVPEPLAPTEHLAMAPGPRGLFLLADGPSSVQSGRLALWRWSGRRFRIVGRLPRATAFTATDGIALAQAGDGALVAVWNAIPADEIDAAVSTDGGRRWSPARTLSTQVQPIYRLTAAFGRGGRGIIAYDLAIGGVWMARTSVSQLQTGG